MSWRNGMRTAAVGLLLLVSVPPPADAFHEVRTIPREQADYYPWIAFLSKGPAEKLPEARTPLAYYRAYRVVVVQDPQQPLVFVEEIVSGEAGCCVRLSSIVELDLVQLYETFDIPEDSSGFRLIAWQSPTAFSFSIEDRCFLLTGLGNRQVRIEEQPPTGNP